MIDGRVKEPAIFGMAPAPELLNEAGSIKLKLNF